MSDWNFRLLEILLPAVVALVGAVLYFILAGKLRLTGDMAMVAQDGQTEKVVVGDIGGKIWRGQALPPGTYGLWAQDGFIT